MTASTGAWPVDQTLVTTPSEGKQAIVSRDVASCDSRTVGSRYSLPSILAWRDERARCWVNVCEREVEITSATHRSNADDEAHHLDTASDTGERCASDSRPGCDDTLDAVRLEDEQEDIELRLGQQVESERRNERLGEQRRRQRRLRVLSGQSEARSAATCLAEAGEDDCTHPEREPARVRGERRILDLDVERAFGGVRRRPRSWTVAGGSKSLSVRAFSKCTESRDEHGTGNLGVLHLDVGRAVGLVDQARLEDCKEGVAPTFEPRVSRSSLARSLEGRSGRCLQEM